MWLYDILFNSFTLFASKCSDNELDRLNNDDNYNTNWFEICPLFILP